LNKLTGRECYLTRAGPRNPDGRDEEDRVSDLKFEISNHALMMTARRARVIFGAKLTLASP